ncbi:Inorganic pyrophosphatase [Choanephora cucurbitarum]|uniref:Inorganic pyrophosphatase n=1 Tax=Choanephora cucurbitarum TaxID=101091 RepID=A0A1C7N9E1_9FUNG|nr:Inorganic pyrophosphatase [Choanephora cucurbitarum]
MLRKIPFVRYSSTYRTVSVGKPFTAAHRVYVEKDGQIISPFHDIPLYANKEDKQVVNMVVEIPRWTNAKVEISTDEQFNPLKQDVKKGKPRFVRNCFPHKGYIWNYGALPQTWEDPTYIHEDTNAKGDNDPIDVIEIGQEIGKQGQIKQVKVLGVMAMLDEGETDWKVVAIDTKDPLASKIHDVEDIDHHFPGLLDATRHFFRVYKVPDGKPENEFAYNGECKNQTFANTIVAETHEAWQRLIEGKVPKTTDTYHLEVHNLTVEKSPYRTDKQMTVKEETFENIKEQEVKEYDPKWYFVA